MRKRNQHEEHVNHERWLVSYADFITLLFAFFVVMYAISSVNEGKYRVLSDSLVTAFKDPTRSMQPVQVGEVLKSLDINADAMNPPTGKQYGLEFPPEQPGDEAVETVPQPEEQKKARDQGDTSGEQDQEQQGEHPGAKAMTDVKTIADELQKGLSPLIDEGLIELRREDNWVEIEMKTNILFGSGSSRLAKTALPVLKKLADQFARFNNPIQVEGFTDNKPIHTLAFPSNWELSAARAASVVHLFAQFGITPGRMSAIGYGEHRPVADNSTPEGRRKNRRVVIIIAADADTRRIVDLARAHEAGVETRAAAAPVVSQDANGSRTESGPGR